MQTKCLKQLSGGEHLKSKEQQSFCSEGNFFGLGENNNFVTNNFVRTDVMLKHAT